MTTNAFGAPPRPARPTEFGQGYSGNAAEVKPGPAQEFLNVELKPITPQGYCGLATLHIAVKDVSRVPAGQLAPNAMLIAEISWQSGRGGGREIIDITRGALFPIGGTEIIVGKAQLVSSIEGEPVQAWVTKRVDVTVNWFGNPIKPAKITLPTVTLVANVPSVFQAIPLQAQEMVAGSPEPALFPNLVAEFSTSDDPAGTGIKYATLNPNANGTPIWHGVEFVRFQSPKPMRVFAGFELW